MTDPIAHRWHTLLEAAPFDRPADANEGRAALRRGRVTDVDVASGCVEATVRDSSGASLRTRILWAPEETATWADAARALSRQLRYIADLIDGRVSDAVVTAIEQAGIALVASPEDVVVDCPCPRRSMWCEHAAAVIAAFAARLERRPELALVLRGCSVESLAHQAGAGETGVSAVPSDDGDEGERPIDDARGDLDAIVVRPVQRHHPGLLLAELAGPPPTVDVGALVEVVEDAARFAWRLAAGEGTDVADDELLLAALRAQGAATVDSLSSALGSSPDDVRHRLEVLHARGEVLRAGSADDAGVRYRAANRGPV